MLSAMHFFSLQKENEEGNQNGSLEKKDQSQRK